MGIAHGRADILVAEELLDFPQILPNPIEQNRRRTVSQSVGCDLPHPERSARGPQAKVERPVGKRSPRISRKHKRRNCKTCLQPTRMSGGVGPVADLRLPCPLNRGNFSL
jgi:hypothetical protein